jgi:Ser/Thr protein kinase RdoA (MazF antagonist)
MARSNTRGSSVAGYWALVTAYRSETRLSAAEARADPVFRAAYAQLQAAKRDLAETMGSPKRSRRGGRAPSSKGAELRAARGRARLVEALSTLGWIGPESQRLSLSPKVVRAPDGGVVVSLRGFGQRF